MNELQWWKNDIKWRDELWSVQSLLGKGPSWGLKKLGCFSKWWFVVLHACAAWLAMSPRMEMSFTEVRPQPVLSARSFHKGKFMGFLIGNISSLLQIQQIWTVSLIRQKHTYHTWSIWFSLALYLLILILLVSMSIFLLWANICREPNSPQGSKGRMLWK